MRAKFGGDGALVREAADDFGADTGGAAGDVDGGVLEAGVGGKAYRRLLT